MSPIPDPLFDRLFAAVRRLWWLVVASTIVGAAILFLTTVTPDYSGALALTPQDDSGPLTVAGLPDDLITRRISMDELVTYLDSLEPEVDAAVPNDFDVTLSVNQAEVVPAGDRAQTLQTLTILASAEDAETVTLVLKLYEQRFLERRDAMLTDSLAAVMTSLTNQLQTVQDRVAALDKQIQGVKTEDTLLAQALQTERSQRADEVSKIQISIRAVDDYGTDADKRTSTIPTAIKRPKSLVSLGTIAGAIVGAVFGLIVVGLLALLDRRLRTGADVLVATGATVLGVATGSEHGSDRLVPLLRTVAHTQKKTALMLVAVDVQTTDSPGLTALVERCRSEDPDLEVRSCSVEDALTTGPGDAQSVLTVLVVMWGASRLSALRSASRGLVICERPAIGTAVIGVPERLSDSMFT